METTENTRKQAAMVLSPENIASPMASPFVEMPFKTVGRDPVHGVVTIRS